VPKNETAFPLCVAVYSAQQHYMLSALYYMAVTRPSVRPSVIRMDHTKTVKDRIIKFLP